MVKIGQKWYKIENVAEKYDDRRFTEGGKILNLKEQKTLLSLVDPKGKKILDIATGTGRFAETLSKNGGNVIGLDASREMLRQGKVDCVQGDALKLPFDEKCFDVSISMRFLHLLDPKDIRYFIEEVGRVTKKKFVFESLHPLSLRMLYQWALPQGSRLYSNSFLKEKFRNNPVVKKVRSHEKFIIPYGIYQTMPEDLGEEIMDLDEKISDKHEWLASTVYWEIYF